MKPILRQSDRDAIFREAKGKHEKSLWTQLSEADPRLPGERDPELAEDYFAHHEPGHEVAMHERRTAAYQQPPAPQGGARELPDRGSAHYILLPHDDPERAVEIMQEYHSMDQGKRHYATPQFDDTDIMSKARGGGFTFHDHVGDAPAGGYMVSPSKTTEKMYPIGALKPEHIHQYVSAHAHELSNPDAYLGGWLDKGKFYLDVSRHRPTLDRAVHDAVNADQLAIYDIGKGKAVNTPQALAQTGDIGLGIKDRPRNPMASRIAGMDPEQAQQAMLLQHNFQQYGHPYAHHPDHDYLQHELGDDEHWGRVQPEQTYLARLAVLNPDGSFDMKGLADTGKHVGTHSGTSIFNDKASGENWLMKPAPPGGEFLADLDTAGNQIAHMSGLETPATFKTTAPNGQPASIQKMYPNAKDAFPIKDNMASGKLNDEDMMTIQKHHALDWMIGNHDSHTGQFIRGEDGKLIGIDKGQAFKYANNDKLHWGFHPNGALYGEGEPIYNSMYREMAQGGKMLQDPRQGEYGKFIQGLQAIPDHQYAEMLRPYAEGAAKVGQLGLDFSKNKNYDGWVAPAKFKPNDVEAFLAHAVARKNSLGNDMGDLYDRAMAHRMTGTKIAKTMRVGDAPDPAFLKSLHKQMGTHGARLFADPQGTQWLVKPPAPGAEFMAPLDNATATLQAKSGLDGPETHMIPWHDGHASAVKMIPGVSQAFQHPPRLKDLSPDDITTLQKHQAFDWLISNHDGHVGNFMRTPEGGLVGIDKGQAFKYFGRDKLSPNFHPNYYAREPVYNQLWRDFSGGHPGEMQDPRAKHSPLGQYIQKLQDIPDATLKNMFRPYAEQAAGVGLLANPNDDGKGNVDPQRGLDEASVAPNDAEGFLSALVKRKNNLSNDLGTLYDRSFQQRQTAPPVQPRGKHEMVPPDSPSYVQNKDVWNPQMPGLKAPKPFHPAPTDPNHPSMGHTDPEDDFWKISMLEEMGL